MKKLVVTQHAAERWVERVEPELTVSRAQERMLDLWASASRRREKTVDGAERWRIEEPLAEIIARQERGSIVAVSVIGPEEIARMEAEAEAPQEAVNDSAWPPHGELTLVVKIRWDLKGGTRDEASDSIRRCVSRRIRELVGVGTGNAVIEGLEIVPG